MKNISIRRYCELLNFFANRFGKPPLWERGTMGEGPLRGSLALPPRPSHTPPLCDNEKGCLPVRDSLFRFRAAASHGPPPITAAACRCRPECRRRRRGCGRLRSPKPPMRGRRPDPSGLRAYPSVQRASWPR